MLPLNEPFILIVVLRFDNAIGETSLNLRMIVELGWTNFELLHGKINSYPSGNSSKANRKDKNRKQNNTVVKPSFIILPKSVAINFRWSIYSLNK